jgi:hypothetical protein
MGKQVNFYMTEEDEREFLEFVHSDRNVAVFMGVQQTAEIAVLDELPTSDTSGWFQLWLWDRDHSPTPVLRYVQQQGHYCVDRFESEVIEFDRSILDEGRLVRGRIWAEMNGWRHDDPASVIKKSEAFSKWFDRLGNWIKRRSTRDSVGDFLLPGATQFSKQGGQLCQVVLGSGDAH